MQDATSEVKALWDDLMASIEDVLKTGQSVTGPNVTAFESEVADYLRVRHAIAVNSSTSALLIALRAVGVSAGDEVITTAFTSFSTVEAILLAGAKPVFVDIDERTWNLDTDCIEAALTPRTRAVLPVHLYGQPAAMGPIMELAERHQLRVVEDCGHAFGARYQGWTVGAIGDVGCFSFYPSKNLGALSDSGLLCTNDDDIAHIARMLQTNGTPHRYRSELVRFHTRLDEMQAAVLRVKLPYVDAWNKARREVARSYTTRLSHHPGILPPYVPQQHYHVYHHYTVSILGGLRDEARRKLADCGVDTTVYPVPIHRLPMFTGEHYVLPRTEEAAGQVLSLPMGPFLTTQDVDDVVACLEDVIPR